MKLLKILAAIAICLAPLSSACAAELRSDKNPVASHSMYDVNFVDADGKLVMTESLAYNQPLYILGLGGETLREFAVRQPMTLDLPDALTSGGYIFVEWIKYFEGRGCYLEQSCLVHASVQDSEGGLIAEKDMDIGKKVRLISRTGGIIAEYSVNKPETITLPAPSAADGYQFSRYAFSSEEGNLNLAEIYKSLIKVYDSVGNEVFSNALNAEEKVEIRDYFGNASVIYNASLPIAIDLPAVRPSDGLVFSGWRSFYEGGSYIFQPEMADAEELAEEGRFFRRASNAIAEHALLFIGILLFLAAAAIALFLAVRRKKPPKRAEKGGSVKEPAGKTRKKRKAKAARLPVKYAKRKMKTAEPNEEDHSVPKEEDEPLPVVGTAKPPSGSAVGDESGKLCAAPASKSRSQLNSDAGGAASSTGASYGQEDEVLTFEFSSDWSTPRKTDPPPEKDEPAVIHPHDVLEESPDGAPRFKEKDEDPSPTPVPPGLGDPNSWREADDSEAENAKFIRSPDAAEQVAKGWGKAADDPPSTPLKPNKALEYPPDALMGEQTENMDGDQAAVELPNPANEAFNEEQVEVVFLEEKIEVISEEQVEVLEELPPLETENRNRYESDLNLKGDSIQSIYSLKKGLEMARDCTSHKLEFIMALQSVDYLAMNLTSIGEIPAVVDKIGWLLAHKQAYVLFDYDPEYLYKQIMDTPSYCATDALKRYLAERIADARAHFIYLWQGCRMALKAWGVELFNIDYQSQDYIVSWEQMREGWQVLNLDRRIADPLNCRFKVYGIVAFGLICDDILVRPPILNVYSTVDDLREGNMLRSWVIGLSGEDEAALAEYIDGLRRESLGEITQEWTDSEDGYMSPGYSEDYDPDALPDEDTAGEGIFAGSSYSEGPASSGVEESGAFGAGFFNSDDAYEEKAGRKPAPAEDVWNEPIPAEEFPIDPAVSDDDLKQADYLNEGELYPPAEEKLATERLKWLETDFGAGDCDEVNLRKPSLKPASDEAEKVEPLSGDSFAKDHSGINEAAGDGELKAQSAEEKALPGQNSYRYNFDVNEELKRTVLGNLSGRAEGDSASSSHGADARFTRSVDASYAAKLMQLQRNEKMKLIELNLDTNVKKNIRSQKSLDGSFEGFRNEVAGHFSILQKPFSDSSFASKTPVPPISFKDGYFEELPASQHLEKEDEKEQSASERAEFSESEPRINIAKRELGIMDLLTAGSVLNKGGLPHMAGGSAKDESVRPSEKPAPYGAGSSETHVAGAEDFEDALPGKKAVVSEEAPASDGSAIEAKIEAEDEETREAEIAEVKKSIKKAGKKSPLTPEEMEHAKKRSLDIVARIDAAYSDFKTVCLNANNLKLKKLINRFDKAVWDMHAPEFICPGAIKDSSCSIPERATMALHDANEELYTAHKILESCRIEGRGLSSRELAAVVRAKNNFHLRVVEEKYAEFRVACLEANFTALKKCIKDVDELLVEMELPQFIWTPSQPFEFSVDSLEVLLPTV
ncbi:MAG: hypothetical protein LBU32_26850 [Clostridiales bacterium]|nr:hypothetical protein [Clostridiales bacterium]